MKVKTVEKYRSVLKEKKCPHRLPYQAKKYFINQAKLKTLSDIKLKEIISLISHNINGSLSIRMKITQLGYGYIQEN